MFAARSLTLAATSLLACMLGVLPSSATPAPNIDYSLNVFYTNPGNPNSGGTWSITAKSTDFGLGAATVRLNNIGTAQDKGPRGTVNGNDPAGFSLFVNQDFTIYRELTIAQVPVDLTSGEEQSACYGVGTLTNGAPNYPGKPVGSNSIGPAFTSFTNPIDIPWATGDPFGDAAWSTGARLASGAFGPGVTPSFYPGSSGNVFTTLGTSAAYGTLTEATTVSTIVRTNLAQFPDYNLNGSVDAADYVLWRYTDTLPVTPGAGADGNYDGTVNAPDYTLWRSKFSNTGPAGSGASLSTSAVPEPASSILVALGLGVFLCVSRWPRPAVALVRNVGITMSAQTAFDQSPKMQEAIVFCANGK